MATFDISNPLKSQVSHDSENPPNLLAFMLKSWKPRAPLVKAALKNCANFKNRRDILSKQYPGELIIIPTGHYKVRSNDTRYAFRPGTDFYYLTGNLEPDCVLVMAPTATEGHIATLFSEGNLGKSDTSFFTDRVKGELWTGARLTVEESRKLYGIADCHPLAQLKSFLKGAILPAASPKGLRIQRGFSYLWERTIGLNTELQFQKDRELGVFLDEMRLLKDDSELRALAEAVKFTKRGFEDVIVRLKTAKSERELEGVFYTRARMEGNDVGYSSIVASGSHACTLHWNKNNGKIQKGDLLLLDAGIEGNELYTADITRTLPINGKFSKPQREIYEIVLNAQKAAIRKVKPGNDFMEPNRAAMKVLAEGLEALGILSTSAEEALREENQFYKRYSLHNVSHMLGLDVHDCAQARAETYKYGKLLPGMVLTVEPGLYFQTDDLTIPAKYRGIGIRIEDDVVVTAKGCKNLSANVPSAVDDVERWMKTLWKNS